MMSGITWVYSEKGGYYPCSNSQELGEFKKAGFVECGKPSKHKSAQVEEPESAPKEEEQEEQSNELSKEDLLTLAQDSGIHVDRRWSVPRIKDVLGL